MLLCMINCFVNRKDSTIAPSHVWNRALPTCRGCTPLAVAAQTGNSKMVQTLVNRGANMLATDHKGRVPRQLAQAANHRCTAELLSALAKESMIDKAVMREDVEQAGVGALQDVGQNRTPGWSYWRRHMS